MFVFRIHPDVLWDFPWNGILCMRPTIWFVHYIKTIKWIRTSLLFPLYKYDKYGLPWKDSAMNKAYHVVWLRYFPWYPHHWFLSPFLNHPPMVTSLVFFVGGSPRLAKPSIKSFILDILLLDVACISFLGPITSPLLWLLLSSRYLYIFSSITKRCV